MMVDEDRRKVVYYLDVWGSVKGVDSPYKNEYIHKVTMTDNGKNIKMFDASLDSQAWVEWMAKVDAAKAEGNEDSARLLEKDW
jgi:hypothetical protein